MGAGYRYLVSWGQHRSAAAARNSLAEPSPAFTELRPLRGILFDLPGVFHDASRWRRWLWQLAARMGAAREMDSFFAPWDARFAADVFCGKRNHAEACEAFLLDAGLTRCQVEEVQAASEARRRAWEIDARPMPGFREAVLRLRADGMSLGLLADSGRTSEELRGHLNKFVPAEAITAVVSSCDLECARPDARCYRAGLAALGLPAEQVLFVGSEIAELAAAQSLGLAAAALNQPEFPAADLHLESFADLPSRLSPRSAHAATG
ncbi:MAG: HAD family hydrolase [Pirellulales bacterium]